MKINLKRWGWPLLVGVLILTSLYGGFYISTATAFPQNPGTYNYFVAISEMPYTEHIATITSTRFWEEGGDCTDRALAFKEYLESKGAKDVHLIVARNSVNGEEEADNYGGYGHCFILWDGRVYNPMPPGDKYSIYGGDFEDYKRALKTDYGYNIIYIDCGSNGRIFL